MNKHRFILITPLLFLLFSNSAHACRFWCALSDVVPRKFILKQLLEDSNSLKSLGKDYADGWSIGYYLKNEPMIFRSPLASDVDPLYDKAVRDVGLMQSNIVYGHLRKASSGCVENVPNPHPFVRELFGKKWIFAHNGGIEKQVLIDLIGENYLKEHQPFVCDHSPPESWIDSELYFIYLLKMVEESNGDVAKGLNNALRNIYDVISLEDRYLNFFLSDGDGIWVFRKGNSLSYKVDQKLNVVAVASSVPDERENWNEFPENTLAYISKDVIIKFYDPILIEENNSEEVIVERFSE